jgi:hypothetical protein
MGRNRLFRSAGRRKWAGTLIGLLVGGESGSSALVGVCSRVLADAGHELLILLATF